MVKMLRTACFLPFVIQVVFCQNRFNQTEFLTNGNKKYELVPQDSLETLTAIQKCGEGNDSGLHRCVPYHQCNPLDNIINEVARDEINIR